MILHDMQVLTQRQGDLGIIEIQSLPKTKMNVKHNGIILAGEKTGHNHVLKGGQLLVMEKPKKQIIGYGKIEQETQIIHDEHKPIILKPGLYMFVRQREHTPGQSQSFRMVQD